jgi:hypothetical protein
MSPEETLQVQQYIAQLTANHEKQVLALKKELEFEKRQRKIAQADSLKMGTAVLAIWNHSRQQPPVETTVFSTNVRQIIDYYAPDFDVPF